MKHIKTVSVAKAQIGDVPQDVLGFVTNIKNQLLSLFKG